MPKPIRGPAVAEGFFSKEEFRYDAGQMTFTFAPQNVGPGGKTRRHALEDGLVLKARHTTETFGAAFAQAACTPCRRRG